MKKIIWIMILCFIPLTYMSFGADAMYRLLHNDHDTLIIGEIKAIDKNGIQVDVSKTIVSNKDLRVNEPKQQLKPKEVNIEKVQGYIFHYEKKSSTYLKPAVGDYILASLNKGLNGKYKVAWGCYKLSSLDYKTLDIMVSADASEYQKMDASAIKSFINSNGQNTEFSFNGNTYEVELNKNGDRTTIYKGNKQSIVTVTPVKVDVNVTTTSLNIAKEKGELLFIAIGSILFIVSIILLISYRKFKK